MKTGKSIIKMFDVHYGSNIIRLPKIYEVFQNNVFLRTDILLDNYMWDSGLRDLCRELKKQIEAENALED